MTIGYLYKPPQKKAFTLIELLVVIAVIAMLIAVILPSLRKVRWHTRKLICAANLRSVGMSIHAYASDYNDTIPFGPQAPLATPTNFYPITGMVTSLLSLESGGAPVGLGLLLDGYLSDQPKVLFCPATDQNSDAEEQLARVGEKQAQCDYYYRHASATTSSVNPDTFHFRLSDPKENRDGRVITALAMDVQFLGHPALIPWGIKTRTAHQRKNVNVLLADGRVISVSNNEKQFTIDCTASPFGAPGKILSAFEKADELR